MTITNISADEFRRNAILHTLLFIQYIGGFCRKSQFPKEWNEDLLHGALEVLISGNFIKKVRQTYSLVVPEEFLLNEKRTYSVRNSMKGKSHAGF